MKCPKDSYDPFTLEAKCYTYDKKGLVCTRNQYHTGEHHAHGFPLKYCMAVWDEERM